MGRQYDLWTSAKPQLGSVHAAVRARFHWRRRSYVLLAALVVAVMTMLPVRGFVAMAALSDEEAIAQAQEIMAAAPVYQQAVQELKAQGIVIDGVNAATDRSFLRPNLVGFGFNVPGLKFDAQGAPDGKAGVGASMQVTVDLEAASVVVVHYMVVPPFPSGALGHKYLTTLFGDGRREDRTETVDLSQLRSTGDRAE